ncbi:hypothetical protein [Microbacterium suwonense]|uniref:Ig-like domain-containing protein n=2 Tax=Microbacterium suwonense TaxID=683047 RepID=A0ABN6X5A1_9MICO|nr:hypothetical protein [Microbacterium suwonense]BDZ39920.1 hypothetical protein GCM10025863_25340 [Microbacterium suwonense]
METPASLALEQPFRTGQAHGSSTRVGMSAACDAPTTVQYQWRNDGAGGNQGVWQGWFAPNDGTRLNGRPTFSTSAISVTWGSWYGSSVQARCVGVFANSGNVSTQTTGVQAAIPPKPTNVSLSVNPGNVNHGNVGSYWVGNTSASRSTSWSASASGSCPSGTYTRWTGGTTSASATISVYSGSAGTYSNSATRTLGGGTIYCTGSASGVSGPGASVSSASRTVSMSASFSHPPIPSTPTGASLRCNGDFGRDCCTDR